MKFRSFLKSVFDSSNFSIETVTVILTRLLPCSILCPRRVSGAPYVTPRLSFHSPLVLWDQTQCPETGRRRGRSVVGGGCPPSKSDRGVGGGCVGCVGSRGCEWFVGDEVSRRCPPMNVKLKVSSGCTVDLWPRVSFL